MRSLNRPGVLSTDALVGAPQRWAPDDLALSLWGADIEHAGALSVANEAAESEGRLQSERERELAAARAEAFEEGRLAGAEEAGTRVRTVVAAAEAALDRIRGCEARWQENVAENIAALAVTVARHVVGREISENPAGVAELVRCALAEFPIDQPMRVRVNPYDLSLLSATSPQGGDDVIAIGPNRNVRWMADPRVQPGGCVVEGRERIIDGRVDTALERLYRQITATNA